MRAHRMKRMDEMADIVYLAIGLGLFAACLVMLRLCEGLLRG